MSYTDYTTSINKQFLGVSNNLNVEVVEANTITTDTLNAATTNMSNGTFTPVLQFGTSIAHATYSAGNYVQIGPAYPSSGVIIFSLTYKANVIPATGNNLIVNAGLPATDNTQQVMINVINSNGINYGTGITIYAIVLPLSSNMSIYAFASGSVSSILPATDFSSSTSFTLTGVYSI